MQPRPNVPILYLGGHPGLDFVNTVDWTPHGLVEEQLVEYGDLLRWAQGAGLISKKLAAALQDTAAKSPAAKDLALASARHTRWVMRRLFASLADGRLDQQALAAFNEILNESARRLMLSGARAPNRPGLQWQWRGLESSCEAPLWPVVWAAAQLLTSADTALIKECGGHNCGWLFVDRSRNGLRRWCQMSTCGTREKSRRRGSRASARS
jgi:predicted RNA-binding Zn ribbon-like protein